MEFVEVMKHRKRMCNSIRACQYCPLYSGNNGISVICHDIIITHPEEAEKIIMKWAEEHPIKTNRQVFEEVLKEKFGDTFDMPRLMGRLNTCNIYSEKCPVNDNCKTCDQKKFWDKEYKEVEKDAVSN